MRASWKQLGVATVVLAFVLGACGSDDSKGGSKGGATRSATVREYKVSVVPPAGPAGKNNFEVRNTGKIAHEFVIFKTDLAPDDLPLNKDGDAVDEEGEGVEHVDEIEDINPGKTKSLTVDLDAGKYVLICNLPTHYKLGMHTAFEVT